MAGVVVAQIVLGGCLRPPFDPAGESTLTQPRPESWPGASGTGFFARTMSRSARGWVRDVRAATSSSRRAVIYASGERRIMKMHSALPLLIAFAVGTLSCSDSDGPARSKAIESAITEAFQPLEIPTGPEVRFSSEALGTFLRRGESSGLLQIHHPSAYPSDVFEVIATPKLMPMVLNPDQVWTPKDSENFLGGEGGTDLQRFTAKVRGNQAAIDKIVNDDVYTGSLAGPGEKHRVVLGTFRNNPTPVTLAMLGVNEPARQEPLQSFRCIVRYNEFNKTWRVVALDLGSIEDEKWYTSNVR
jgi:hypothetical protein